VEFRLLKKRENLDSLRHLGPRKLLIVLNSMLAVNRLWA
jgi:hypothetical protein